MYVGKCAYVHKLCDVCECVHVCVHVGGQLRLMLSVFLDTILFIYFFYLVFHRNSPICKEL